MRSSDWVDISQPVNWLSGFNAGLEFWWLCLPNGTWQGGSARDLTRRFDFSPTAITQTDWKGAIGRQGGHGSVQFDASDTMYFTHADTQKMAGFSELTLMAWINQTADPGASWGRIFHKANGTTSDDWSLTSRAGTRRVVMRVTVGASATTVQGLSNPPSGWSHFCGRWRGSDGNTEVFLNGVSDGSGTSNTGSLDDNNGAMAIGRHVGSTGRYIVGYVDDIRAYSRYLSVREIQSYMLESSRGYPNTLNWAPNFGFKAPAAAGTWMTTYRRRRAG